MTQLSTTQFPSEPVPALVFRHAYLWKREHKEGLTDALKKRPAVVVVRYGPLKGIPGQYAVDVAPITHSPQDHGDTAVEIPRAVKARMGLDDDASWIVTSEMNRFIWPSPDLYPSRPGSPGRPKLWHWGVLPQNIFRQVVQDVLEARINPDNVIRRAGR